MREVFIYNKEGDIVDTLILPEEVDFVSGRTSKSTSCFYKGVGAKYKCHAYLNTKPYKVLGKNPVFYYGYDVQNPKWIGKFGIFREKFQPFFSDFIGTCGPKEESLLFKSANFSFSAVEVLDQVKYDLENNQSYYKLKYTSPRDQFIDDGATIDFINLMDCMLHEGWNFPWDKTAVRDINKLGKVTDVADIFFSHDPVHKFGTVYSVLFSTFKLAPLMYTKLTSQMGIKSVTIESVPFITFFILNKLGFDLPMREDVLDKQGLYVHLIGNILLRGRNCASVEDVSLGDSIMVDYVDRFRSTLSDKHKRIVRI